MRRVSFTVIFHLAVLAQPAQSQTKIGRDSVKDLPGLNGVREVIVANEGKEFPGLELIPVWKQKEMERIQKLKDIKRDVAPLWAKLYRDEQHQKNEVKKLREQRQEYVKNVNAANKRIRYNAYKDAGILDLLDDQERRELEEAAAEALPEEKRNREFPHLNTRRAEVVAKAQAAAYIAQVEKTERRMKLRIKGKYYYGILRPDPKNHSRPIKGGKWKDHITKLPSNMPGFWNAQKPPDYEKTMKMWFDFKEMREDEEESDEEDEEEEDDDDDDGDEDDEDAEDEDAKDKKDPELSAQIRPDILNLSVVAVISVFTGTAVMRAAIHFRLFGAPTAGEEELLDSNA